jgi:hypothetical protein
MDHMNFLESVALSDCAVLENKEATYQGSWKLSGGRSAWFMAKRNIDRLLVMMAPKEFPDHVKTMENIHCTIGAFRNFVHYGQRIKLDLPGSIEATMMILELLRDRLTSEDIFAKIEEKPKGEDGTVLAVCRDLRRYLILVEAEMISRGVVEPESRTYESTYNQPETDVYQMIADDKGLSREEVEARVRAMFYPPAEPPPTADVIDDATVARDIGEERGPDGGEQHESLVPWVIDQPYYDALKIRVGAVADMFYTVRASGVYQLEPIVGAHHCPRELAHVYEYVKDNRWALKRQHVPESIDDNFPRLIREMNSKEYDESRQDFKFMYYQDDGDGKYKLSETFSHWAREPN